MVGGCFFSFEVVMAKYFKSLKRPLIISDHRLDINAGLNDVCTRKRGFGTLGFAEFEVELCSLWSAFK